MMMVLSKNKRLKRVLKVLLFILLFSLILWRLKEGGKERVSKPEEVLLSGLTFLQKGGREAGRKFGQIRRNFAKINELEKEHERLEKELFEQKARNNRLYEYYLKQRHLVKLLKFKEETPFSQETARVIARDPTNWFATLVIDKGELSGLKRGLPVVTEEGLAGRIFKLNKTSAKVLLLSDENSTLGARLQRTREAGVIGGEGGGLCCLKYLSRNSDVKIGDKVITSGLSETIPGGVIIGEVSKVKRRDSSLSPWVEVKPAVNFGRLEEVLVIKEKSKIKNKR